MKKKLIHPFLAVSFSLLLGACSEQPEDTGSPNEENTNGGKQQQTAETKEKETTPSSAAWSYGEDKGPGKWGELDPAYSSCANGKEQSPINIESAEVKVEKASSKMQIDYGPATFSLENDGHSIQATPATDKNLISLDGKEYKLAQFHFHTPSEHQLNGQDYKMELHLVHQDKNGGLAVLGLMIQEGDENEQLTPVWNVMPTEETKKEIPIKEPIDVNSLLPEDQTALHYNGSLTTPPCTEEVKWIVLEQPINMSSEQIDAFQAIFPDNHRPVQPLEDREIRKY